MIIEKHISPIPHFITHPKPYVQSHPSLGENWQLMMGVITFSSGVATGKMLLLSI